MAQIIQRIYRSAEGPGRRVCAERDHDRRKVPSLLRSASTYVGSLLQKSLPRFQIYKRKRHGRQTQEEVLELSKGTTLSVRACPPTLQRPSPYPSRDRKQIQTVNRKIRASRKSRPEKAAARSRT